MSEILQAPARGRQGEMLLKLSLPGEPGLIVTDFQCELRYGYVDLVGSKLLTD